MKSYMIILALPTLLLAATVNKNLIWVDEQIEAIKPSRKGLEKHATATLRDPFYEILRINRMKDEEPVEEKMAAPAPVTQEQPLMLQAIMNSKSVKINDKWYKLDDELYGYTVKDIDRTSVLLQKRKKTLKLYTASTKSNIKIQIK